MRFSSLSCGFAVVITLSLSSSPVSARDHRPGPLTRAALRADRECARDGRLRHHYSARVLTLALRLLPLDVAQYTPCVSILKDARRRELRHEHSQQRHRRAAASR